jgi:hypothetical protein
MHLREGGRRRVVVEHAGLGLRDLCQRPEGDAVAGGETAAAHHAGLRGGGEFRHEPALADARIPVDRDQVRAPLARDAAQQAGKELELGVAADDRRA